MTTPVSEAYSSQQGTDRSSGWCRGWRNWRSVKRLPLFVLIPTDEDRRAAVASEGERYRGFEAKVRSFVALRLIQNILGELALFWKPSPSSGRDEQEKEEVGEIGLCGKVHLFKIGWQFFSFYRSGEREPGREHEVEGDREESRERVRKDSGEFVTPDFRLVVPLFSSPLV